MGIKKYLLGESSFTEAYWITPTGQILDCGSKKHIDFVCQMPRKFGLTEQEIQSIYDKHGEPYGFEGKAREEVIIKVLQQGFTRIRKYKDRWSINVRDWNRKTAKILSNWAYEILQGPNKDKYIPVNIDVFSGNPPKNIDMEGLSGLHESHNPIKLITLNEMEDII